MKQTWRTRVALLLFLVMAAVLTIAIPYTSTGVAVEPAKKLDGKTIFEQKCLKCHKLAKFKEQENSRKEWVLILSRMQRGTCDINDKELEALADYLAKTYGN